MPHGALVARRYRRLGVIGRGATGTVHRAHDRATGRVLALKTLVLDPSRSSGPPGDGASGAPSSSEGTILLEREFVLLAGLRHPNLIASLDYGCDEVFGPFFTMDLHEEATTLRAAAERQPTSTKIDLLVQLLHALAYLHRRGLVHRDLKPENALCARGVVKLIDLGLAAPIGEVADDGAGGTLAYAAPELVRGLPADERTDLYAFGVLAYEILSGVLPFDAASPAKLLQRLFTSTPDFARPGLEPQLVDVLRRLLARDAADRFGDALEVVDALSHALDRPLSVETASTRQSFLHAAAFVGRDAERGHLRGMLPVVREGMASEPPVEEPRAGAVVVAGESGAGKSRLLEELAVDAMVCGVRVLRGQALREGSRPYEPWRGVLRLLVLLAEPRDLEMAVIAELVPETKALLGREVPAAPELDPEATHVRLMRVLEALLRRCNEPLLVMLEDLQWAGTESLKLFARVQALASELPLLVVATYRSGEQLSLPRELAAADTVLLEPLSAGAIDRLCASMLGERGSAMRDELVALVHGRSGGNPFLALEVMRTLANEAGGLDRVSMLPLADERFAEEGAGALVQRRVEHLSESDRALLRTAAVAGRELDLDILAMLHPELDIEACATRAVEAAVLSSAQGRWWFAHDKLRDASIEALPDPERRRIHRALAHAILARTPAHASTLAHHFGAAGDTAREKEFSARAGSQFLRSGAYHDAIPFLRRASALSGPGEPRLARATVERQLGEALFRSGQLVEAREHLGKALSTLGRPLPLRRPELVIALGQEALTQLRLRVRYRDGRPVPQRAEDETYEEAILAYTELSRLAHHLNDEALVLYVTLSALNLSERGGLRAHHARLAAVMGAVMGLGPVHPWARFYFGLAEAISSRLGDPTIQAFVLVHRGYYEAGMGHWSKAEQDLVQSRELYDRIGDIRLAEESVSILAYALFFKGELKRSDDLYRELERSGDERVDTQITGWGATNRLKVRVRNGELARADEMLRHVDGLLVDGITRAVRDGIEVELALARGDLDAAYETAVAAMDRLERAPPRTFMVVSTYAAIADALLRRWKASEQAGRLDDVAVVRGRAARANRALAKIARVFPIAEAAKLLHEGTFEALSGRQGRARSLWLQAARVAAERELPFEESLASNALAGKAAGAEREGPRTGLDRARAAKTSQAPSSPP